MTLTVIAVCRNSLGVAWSGATGLHPSKAPDLPFGVCWSSGLASNVHLIFRGEEDAVEAIVTDEQGTLHWFVSAPNRLDFVPLPHALSQQDFAMTSLEMEESGDLIFTRKHGTKLRFSSDPGIEVICEGVSENERHVYHRMTSASDRFGTEMRHVYSTRNRGLIPDKVTCCGYTMLIYRNREERVARIVDPAGNFLLYEYKDSTQVGGAPLLIRRSKQICGSEREHALYDYDEYNSLKEEVICHCNLSEITAKQVNTYRFEYSREALESGGMMYLPIKSVTLPADFGTAEFTLFPDRPGEPGVHSRRVFVADADGNGTLYQFQDRRAQEIELGDAVLAEVRMHSIQTVSYFEGNKLSENGESGQFEPGPETKILGTESFQFDLAAGGSLSSATDMGGNTNRFLYEEEISSGDGELSHPFRLRHCDPTQWKTPMGRSTRIEYSDRFRIPIKVTDPLGRVTVSKVTGPLEVIVSRSTYATEEDFEKGIPFALTVSEYGDQDFPGFETRKVVRKTGATPEELTWEVDLVEVYTPDGYGRLDTLTYDPEGQAHEVKHVYDKNGNLRSRVHSTGYRIDFKFDGFNRITGIYERSSGPSRVTSRQIYGITGLHLEFEKDGSVSEYDYDGLGRRIEIIQYAPGKYPKHPGEARQFRYNAAGSTLVGVEGNYKYEGEYDGLQRTVRLDYDDDTWIVFTYEERFGDNRFESSPDLIASQRYSENSFISVHEYNSDGLIVETIKQGRSTGKTLSEVRYKYDAAGNLTEVEDSIEGMTLHYYDALDRRIKTVLPNGRVLETLYTSTGLEYVTTSPNGDRSFTEYDSVGDPVDGTSR